VKNRTCEEYSTKTLLEFFRKEIKRVERIPEEELEPLLFAIAYCSRRVEFEKAAQYVLKRF